MPTWTIVVVVVALGLLQLAALLTLIFNLATGHTGMEHKSNNIQTSATERCPVPFPQNKPGKTVQLRRDSRLEKSDRRRIPSPKKCPELSTTIKLTIFPTFKP